MEREHTRPELSPEAREGTSPTPNGDCGTCSSPHGTYDLDCQDCLETWLSEPEQ